MSKREQHRDVTLMQSCNKMTKIVSMTPCTSPDIYTFSCRKNGANSSSIGKNLISPKNQTSLLSPQAASGKGVWPQ